MALELQFYNSHICIRIPNFFLAITRAMIMRSKAVVSMMKMLAKAITTDTVMLFGSIDISVPSAV